MAKDNERFGYSAGPYRAIEPLKIEVKLFHTGLNVADGGKDLGETEAVDMADVRIEKSGIGPDFQFTKMGDLLVEEEEV